jgi:hypothetical protein
MPRRHRHEYPCAPRDKRTRTCISSSGSRPWLATGAHCARRRRCVRHKPEWLSFKLERLAFEPTPTQTQFSHGENATRRRAHGHSTRRRCRHRRRRAPLPPASPVPRGPPGGAHADDPLRRCQSETAGSGLNCIPPGQGREEVVARVNDSVTRKRVRLTIGEWLKTRKKSRSRSRSALIWGGARAPVISVETVLLGTGGDTHAAATELLR